MRVGNIAGAVFTISEPTIHSCSSFQKNLVITFISNHFFPIVYSCFPSFCNHSKWYGFWHRRKQTGLPSLDHLLSARLQLCHSNYQSSQLTELGALSDERIPFICNLWSSIHHPLADLFTLKGNTSLCNEASQNDILLRLQAHVSEGENMDTRSHPN